MIDAARDALAEVLHELDFDNAVAIADAQIIALLAAPESARIDLAQRLNPWRPIETAPGDGTEILLLSSYAVGTISIPYYAVGGWDVEDVGGEGGWIHADTLEQIEPCLSG